MSDWKHMRALTVGAVFIFTLTGFPLENAAIAIAAPKKAASKTTSAKKTLPYNISGVEKLKQQKGTGLKIKTQSAAIRRTVRVKDSTLRQAIVLYRQNKIDAAMNLLNQLLTKPGLSRSDRGVTLFFMGKSLFSKKLFYASVPYFQTILKEYRREIYYPYSFQRLVWIARRDGRYDVLTQVLRNKKSSLVPRSYRDDVYFFLGKDYFETGSFKRATSSLKRIQPGSVYFHEAQLILAYMLIQRKQINEAIKVLNVVTEAPDENIKGLAFLALGRLFYGKGDDRASALNFGRVSQSSRYWLMAQLESAWAHFRINQPSLALGNVHPFDSEPFAGVFSPEAPIIKGTVFYRLCKYPEAEKAAEDFFSRYLPTYRQIEAFNAKFKNNANGYGSEILKAIFNESGELPPKLTQEVFAQTWFELRLAQLQTLKKEIGLLARSRALAGTQAGELSRRYLEDSMKEISAFVIRRAKPLLLEWEEKLELFLRQASLLRFESAYAMIDFQKRGGKSQFRIQKDQRYEVWTFDEEYWRDELGDYRYLLRSECQGQPS